MALDGELDASNFERFIDDARGLYDGGARTLLLDLGGLTFLASSGLVALHSIVRVFHGEPPDDLEGGWGALHSVGLDVDSGSTQREVQLAGAAAGGGAGPPADRPRSAVRRPRRPGRRDRRLLTPRDGRSPTRRRRSVPARRSRARSSPARG